MYSINDKLNTLYHDERIEKAKSYLVGNGEQLFQIPNLTFEMVQMKQPTWYAQDMVDGVNYLVETAKKGEYIFPVYSEEEIAENPDKKDVQLFYFPGNAANNRFVLLLAGGGYSCVCSIQEAFPVALDMAYQGETVFCLNYRVAKNPDCTKIGLMPLPAEDIAAALGYIERNAEYFNVSMENYVIGGFSAGGHAAALWGTKNHGARKFHIKSPKALFLAYPLINPSGLVCQEAEQIRKVMYGDGYSHETAKLFNIAENIDEEYPPVYVIHCTDDETVPYKDTELFIEVLKDYKVQTEFETGLLGNHGFGRGSNTQAKGWAKRAIQFWDNVKSER